MSNRKPKLPYPTKRMWAVGDLCRFHPIIGLKHDGRAYRITGFTTLGHGQRCAFLDGKSGCVALDALSVPAAGLPDPFAP